MDKVWEYLHDIAEEPDPQMPHLGNAGNITGVCIHKDFTAGQIIPSRYARQLGAQLIRQADLHDAIQDAATKI